MPHVPFFDIVRNSLKGTRRTGTNDTEALSVDEIGPGAARLMIVGNPNVGKSVVFNRLTGTYVVVSNYPGTTVEISRGKMRIRDRDFEVIDTPGMYSLRPISDEERVGRALLLREPADVVLHVVDAKNLDRMLPFTLQLIEADFPVVLAVNMMDEAKVLGVTLDTPLLRTKLGIPVVETIALTGRGIDELRNTLYDYVSASTPRKAPI